MSKRIAQDMAYRQSLMKYAEKYSIQQGPAVYLLLEEPLGWVRYGLWPASPANRATSPTNTRQRS